MKKLLKTKYFLCIVTLIPLLLIMAMIFGFSAQPGEKSMSTSGVIVKFVLKIIMPDFAQKTVAQQANILHWTQFIVRKFAHFSEFAMLGFFLSLHLYLWKLPRYPLFAGISGVLYAAFDEIHQFFNGTRTPQIRDVLIDSTGVICGILLLMLLIRYSIHKNKM